MSRGTAGVVGALGEHATTINCVQQGPQPTQVGVNRSQGRKRSIPLAAQMSILGVKRHQPPRIPSTHVLRLKKTTARPVGYTLHMKHVNITSDAH